MVPTLELAQNSYGILKKADLWAHIQRHYSVYLGGRREFTFNKTLHNSDLGNHSGGQL